MNDAFKACPSGGALVAFSVVQLEHAEAFAVAAERTQLPMVMQISQDTVRYHGRLTPLALATLSIARECDQPIVVQLDQASSLALVEEAMDLGFASVMVDCSASEPGQSRRELRDLVERAHSAGVSVESAVGSASRAVPGLTVRADPGAAAKFVAETGIDALVVGVGNIPTVNQHSAQLDLALITEFADRVPVPLVLASASGVPDHRLVSAVRAGIRKVNVATSVNRVFTHAVQDHLLREPTLDTSVYLGVAREAMTDEAARLLLLLSSAP